MTPCLWGAQGKPGQRFQEALSSVLPHVAGRSGAGTLPGLPRRSGGAGLPPLGTTHTHLEFPRPGPAGTRAALIDPHSLLLPAHALALRAGQGRRWELPAALTGPVLREAAGPLRVFTLAAASPAQGGQHASWSAAPRARSSPLFCRRRNRTPWVDWVPAQRHYKAERSCQE